MNVFAIVNPLSGAGANPDVAAQRVALLRNRFREAGVDGEVRITERPRHASELARHAVEAGAPMVIAWGGDGTINEIGAVLAGTSTTLAIIPAGSGNGFARELRIPASPDAAVDIALLGRTRAIDVGEFAGRPFFNIAGIGIDAVIADRFNGCAMGKRGMWPYVRIGLREALRYRGARYQITLDGERLESHALLVAFANGREYGNRIQIAPHAVMDDGKLEAVVVDDRAPLARLWSSRHLAFGSVRRAPGLTWRSIVSARVETDGELWYHVDGEPGRTVGSASITIRPGALKVKVAGAPS
jgi:diacylglycerol kinase (ATP)